MIPISGFASLFDIDADAADDDDDDDDADASACVLAIMAPKMSSTKTQRRNWRREIRRVGAEPASFRL